MHLQWRNAQATNKETQGVLQPFYDYSAGGLSINTEHGVEVIPVAIFNDKVDRTFKGTFIFPPSDTQVIVRLGNIELKFVLMRPLRNLPLIYENNV